MILSIATAYFQLRELDTSLEIAQRTLASRKESLTLTQTLEHGRRGWAPGCPSSRATGWEICCRNYLPELQRQIAMQEDVLST